MAYNPSLFVHSNQILVSFLNVSPLISENIGMIVNGRHVRYSSENKSTKLFKDRRISMLAHDDCLLREVGERR
jgi:hypothetical protein